MSDHYKAGDAWRRLSPRTKLIAFVALLIVTAIVVTSTGGLVGRWKDRRFEARESERVRERDELQRDRDAAIGRAELLEKQARELEAKRAIYESLLNSLGQRAEQLKERAENEDQRFVEEMRGIGVDIDAVARCERICSRLGIKKEDCDCH